MVSRKFNESPVIEEDGKIMSVKGILIWQVWKCVEAGSRMHFSDNSFIYCKSTIEWLEAISVVMLNTKFYTEKEELFNEFKDKMDELSGKRNPDIKRSKINKSYELKMRALERSQVIAHFRLILKSLKIGGFLEEDEIAEVFQ